MEISHILTLCTGHIKESTMKLMKQEAEEHSNVLPITIYPTPFGCFVSTACISDNVLKTLPTDLAKCITLAIDHQCAWLLFDSDCEPIAELPDYDW